MTKQKSFKRRVRARMTKTGESYTAARRVLIAQGELPSSPPAKFTPPTSEEAVVAATAHGWQHWFEALDAWGAVRRSHREITRWLETEHGVPLWWCQTIAVAYEQARGLRAPGERPDGFAIGASKTIGVPVEQLFEAFADEALRERWLPNADLRLRTATAPKSARYDWEDGETRVNVYFDAVTESKSRVAVQHERLPDADTADEMKTYWRARVVELKKLLDDLSR